MPAGLTRFSARQVEWRTGKHRGGISELARLRRLVCASRANCYLVVPDDGERMNAGDEVTF